jgi:hypothetical protein
VFPTRVALSPKEGAGSAYAIDDGEEKYELRLSVRFFTTVFFGGVEIQVLSVVLFVAAKGAIGF